MSMADRPVRVPRLVHVVAVEALTPSLIRIVFGGKDLASFGTASSPTTT